MLLVRDMVKMGGNEFAKLSDILCASEDCPLKIILIYRYLPLLYVRHFLEL